MGVKSCSREDCPNIMCDTYINSIGYICFERQNEFKEYLKKYNIELTTEGEIMDELKKFINTPKDKYKTKETTVNDFFKERTE
jgi:hypothetical protein